MNTDKDTPQYYKELRALRDLRAAVRKMLAVRDKEREGEASTEDVLDAIAELEREL
mgnify:CR=1 FL=1